MVTVRFPGEDIAEVDFHEGHRDSAECVPKRYARVCVGGGVDQQTVEARPGLLNPVHQLAFNVGLKEGDLDTELRCTFRDALVDALQVVASVQCRLALTQKVQVGAVQYA